MKCYSACLISALVIFGMVIASGKLLAENQPAGAKNVKYITRGEMVGMLSATDFMKQKISDLFNVAVGYNLVQLNRATMAPIIKYVKVTPTKVSADGVALFDLLVSVEDPGGLADIKDVRADMSSIGRLSNMKLVDNGLWGGPKSKRRDLYPSGQRKFQDPTGRQGDIDRCCKQKRLAFPGKSEHNGGSFYCSCRAIKCFQQ